MYAIYYVYSYLRKNTSSTAPAGTPYYIGKRKGKRAWQKHVGIHVPSNDRIVIIQKNLSENAAKSLEMSLIQQYGRKDLGNGILHNRTNGGDGTSGRVVSNSTRLKVSNSNKGKPKSEETKRKLSISQLGRKKTKESVLKSIATQKRNRELAGKKKQLHFLTCYGCSKEFSYKRFRKFCSKLCIIETRQKKKSPPGPHSLCIVRECPHCEKIGKGSGMVTHIKWCNKKSLLCG